MDQLDEAVRYLNAPTVWGRSTVDAVDAIWQAVQAELGMTDRQERLIRFRPEEARKRGNAKDVGEYIVFVNTDNSTPGMEYHTGLRLSIGQDPIDFHYHITKTPMQRPEPKEHWCLHFESNKYGLHVVDHVVGTDSLRVVAKAIADVARKAADHR